jgi:hypothetical protein
MRLRVSSSIGGAGDSKSPGCGSIPSDPPKIKGY